MQVAVIFLLEVAAAIESYFSNPTRSILFLMFSVVACMIKRSFEKAVRRTDLNEILDMVLSAILMMD
jgi:hypothetical protein